VKKIVIVTNRSEPDHGLLGLLYTMFPNCGVSIVPRHVETFDEFPADCSSDAFKGYKIGTKYNSKYFYL